jgi:sulfatase maturation enzyme AslB (radical SAM superfamily)
MEDIGSVEAIRTISAWASRGLKNIHFSGGEPTLHKSLPLFCNHARACGVERIAISTNGSAPLQKYKELLASGVNDFSVSLDSCCQESMDKMSGGAGALWDRLLENIEYLSSKTYVTLGVVLTNDNIDETHGVIELGKRLGVSDIRIITAAQWKATASISEPDGNMPILNYRLRNIRNGVPMRGLSGTDSPRCKLVLDDMCVVDGKHYPCIIYFRERGKPIGDFTDIDTTRRERETWSRNHDCLNDPICRSQCLDVCREYNNHA